MITIGHRSLRFLCRKKRWSPGAGLIKPNSIFFIPCFDVASTYLAFLTDIFFNGTYFAAKLPLQTDCWSPQNRQGTVERHSSFQFCTGNMANSMCTTHSATHFQWLSNVRRKKPSIEGSYTLSFAGTDTNPASSFSTFCQLIYKKGITKVVPKVRRHSLFSSYF